MNCKIAYVNSCGRAPPLDRKRIQKVVDLACGKSKLRDRSLTVKLVNRRESATLHKKHFKKSNATDVMTFPDGGFDPETKRIHLGDLAVCPDVARKVAPKQGMSERDELTLYVLHGLLHLLGYDDTTPKKSKRMWSAQSRLLGKVGCIQAQRAGIS